MIVENHMIHALKNTTFLFAKSYEITFCVWNSGIVYVLDLFLNINTKSSKNNNFFFTLATLSHVCKLYENLTFNVSH